MQCTLIASVYSLSILSLLGCSKSETQAADEPEFVFVDVAPAAGIDVKIVCGDPRRWYIPESNGSGAAWIDYDSDGDLDLFVANGAKLRYLEDGKRLEQLSDASSRLYRNDGEMNFTDVTGEAGARRSDWVNALATGDVDGDGDTDLFLACFGKDVFLRNDNGVFVDATDGSGLGSELWGAGCAFADIDLDGDLDLFVANYVDFDLEHPPAGGARDVIEGVEVAWGPVGENKEGINEGAANRFYLGDGKGHFTEATSAFGFELSEPLCSYAAIFSDVNSDGYPDLLIANDLQPCNLFMNRAGKGFVEEGNKRGFALNAEGRETSAMGFAVADVDFDGDQDVFRSNFDFETNSYHQNTGSGSFRERAGEHGFAEGTMDRLGWACGFFDAELDGDLDLMIANGHVYPQATEIGMSGWLQTSQLFRAEQDERLGFVWTDATASVAGDLATPRSARSLAFADADNDGDIDVCVIDLDEAPRLLENRTARKGHWVSVRAIGTASNRDSYGAIVQVHAAGRTWTSEVRTADGLYSAHDPRRHFGLGPIESIDWIEVRWPSGRTLRLETPALDSFHTLTEPDAK